MIGFHIVSNKDNSIDVWFGEGALVGSFRVGTIVVQSRPMVTLFQASSVFIPLAVPFVSYHEAYAYIVKTASKHIRSSLNATAKRLRGKDADGNPPAR